MISNRNDFIVKVDKISCILLSILTVFVFIFNYNETRFVGIPAYLWTNIFIVGYMLFVVAICLFSNGKLLWDKSFKWPLLFLIICFISFFYSYAPYETLDRARRMLIMIGLMISVFQFVGANEVNLNKGLKIFVWSGFLAALYLFLNTKALEAGRIGRVIGDPNLIGFTFAFACTISIHYLKEEKKKLYLLPILTMGAAILLTGSRASFGLLIVAILSYVYSTAYQHKWNVFKVVFISIGIVSLIVVGIVLIMNNPTLYKALGMRLLSFYQITHGMESVYHEGSTHLRLVFIKRGFDWFANSPFFLGHGINSFPSYNATFYDGWYTFSHCDYIEILSGVGIPGFIFFFAPYIIWIRTYFVRRKFVDQKYLILLLVLVVEFLLGEMFLCTYYEKGTWIMFALLAGLCKVTEIQMHETVEIDSSDIVDGQVEKKLIDSSNDTKEKK